MEPIIYTAESSMRRPGAFLRAALDDLCNARTWNLAWELARRDISASHRQSLLGLVWGILPTLAIALAFTIAARNRVIEFGSTTIPFAAYIIIGFVLWQTFVDSLMGPLNALYQARPMLARINVPKEALMLGKIWETLFNFALKLPLIVAAIAWYQLPVSWSLLLAPIGVLALVMLGFAIGVLISPIGLLYDDVRKSMPIVVQFGLIVTPVFYALPQAGSFAQIVHANPVTPLLMTTREWITGEPVTLLLPFLCVGIGSFVALLAGFLGLRLVSPFAIERLSS